MHKGEMVRLPIGDPHVTRHDGSRHHHGSFFLEAQQFKEALGILEIEDADCDVIESDVQCSLSLVTVVTHDGLDSIRPMRSESKAPQEVRPVGLYAVMVTLALSVAKMVR